MPTMTMQSVIERRLLVNLRVDPEVARQVVPAPFTPLVRDGSAVAGICCLRLAELRPKGVSRRVGMRVESAAHRIAVEWATASGTRQGVYVARRDTASRAAALLGGRAFPGAMHRAHFTVDESNGVAVAFGGAAGVDVAARPTARWTSTLFASVGEAAAFMAAGPIAYSPSADGFSGVRLAARSWAAEPLELEHLRSATYDDPSAFPPGSVEFDSVMVMRGIPALWIPVGPLEAAPRAARVPGALGAGRS